MTDLIDRIRKKAPSEIDIFAQDHERRSGLTDTKIKDILQNIFKSIDPDKLDNTSLEYTYQTIKSKLRV